MALGGYFVGHHTIPFYIHAAGIDLPMGLLTNFSNIIENVEVSEQY